MNIVLTFVSLNSPINQSVDIFSYTGADEVTEKLRYEEIKPVSKVVGKRYQIQRPPNQMV
jgi:hypothetical protein